jgi:hypothetical protein
MEPARATSDDFTRSHMDALAVKRRRTLVLVAAAACITWGIAGFVSRLDAGYTDALFEPDYTILHVPEGGPLDEAGFQSGDSVISVEGIPVTELGMYSRWPRSLARRPGESLTMVVERDGELVSGEVVYREPSSANLEMRLGGAAIMLSFLGFGLWVLFTVPTPHARRLAYIGLVLAAAVPGPDLGSWNGVRDHIGVLAMALWTLLLLRFFLFFPKPKRIAESRLATGLTYLPFGILAFCLILELIFHPRFYHSFGGFNGLLMLAYAALAVVALAHTAVKTPRQERRASGMNIILVGVVVAVVPSLVAFIDWGFLWNVSIPGSGYFPLLLGVVPLAMALGVRKQARMSAP